MTAIVLTVIGGLGYYLAEENRRTGAATAAVAKQAKEAEQEERRKFALEQERLAQQQWMDSEQARAQYENEELQRYMTWRKAHSNGLGNAPAPDEYATFRQGNFSYKCQSAEGRVSLGNIPCAPDEKTEIISGNANVLSSDGLRAWARRNPERPEYTASIEADRMNTIRQVQQQEQRARCENARRDYNFEAGWRSKHADPSGRFWAMWSEC